MSTKTITSRISNLHFTTAEWATRSSVVLNSGEIGLEYMSDSTFKMKIGDGVTTWANLPYYAVATTIEAIDNLTSTRTDAALTANQGKILKGLIDDLTANVTELETALSYVYGYNNGENN